ncbi:Uncharacterised protein [Legionella bozemanae]|nr:Uncharacterised protein [Legionella bozemanae]
MLSENILFHFLHQVDMSSLSQTFHQEKNQLKQIKKSKVALLSYTADYLT